ncbi:MAG: HDIG domain-containing protein [Clostridia bacterium]|nr:HDIG domain-containing protein [Clostridia bacterium]
MQKGRRKIVSITLTIILTIVIIVCDYFGYIPVKYDYDVGSIATSDIYASRDVVDNYQTKHDAVLKKNQISTISVRSESISDDNAQNVKSFFQLVRQSRSMMVDDLGSVTSDLSVIKENLIINVNDSLGFTLDDSVAEAYLTMSYYAFNYLEDKANSVTEILMMDVFDDANKDTLISNQISMIFEKEATFSSYSDILNSTLKLILKPNTIFDLEATQEAAENEYNLVMSSPVIIEKGTKIVTSGQYITEHEYQILYDLELLRDSQFSFLILIRISVYVVLVSVIFVLFLMINKDTYIYRTRLLVSILVTFIIPIFFGIYASDLSTQAIGILFFTAICSTYIGLNNGIILSLFQLMYILPIYSFDMEVIFTTIIGIIVCACVAGRKNSKNTTASLIIFTTLSVIVSSIVYNFLNGSTQQKYIDSVIWTSISTLISVVAAVGLMPIFELISNTVSPIKLIDLSQPSQPLLKQLFIKAPGTSQHSMMVANLADSAADAVGADALLCKVSAYFHDIGKLEAPEYFTENQDGVNPHDLLDAKASVEIITSHTVNGVALAKKNNLPAPIIDIISEHHGNLYPEYFFKKAIKEAELKGLPAPDPNDFKYSGNIPQSKESAIVMLADTCEAAIKSMKVTNSKDAEEKIRMLIKAKIDHDQLRDSKLSFDDIEKIVQAFTQVYAGFFHERISYSNENKSK